MRKDKDSFSSNLNNIMRRAGYSLKQVQEGTGIPKATLQRWKAEKATPKLESRLMDLANFFGVNLETLLFGDVSKLTKEELTTSRIGRPVNGKELDEKLIRIESKLTPSYDLPVNNERNASGVNTLEAFNEGA